MRQSAIRILLLEDENRIAHLVEAWLQMAEGVTFKVARVASVANAKEMIAALKFDCIISDLNVKNGQGTETVSRLEAVADGIPIVVLTGLDLNSSDEAAIRGHCFDLLYKVPVARNPHLLCYAVEVAVMRARRTWLRKTAMLLPELIKGLIKWAK